MASMLSQHAPSQPPSPRGPLGGSCCLLAILLMVSPPPAPVQVGEKLRPSITPVFLSCLWFPCLLPLPYVFPDLGWEQGLANFRFT